MGITIHYSGQLKEAKLLPSLVEELEDIAKIYDWKTHTFFTEYESDLFKTEDDNNDYGIVLNAPECEPIIFIFDYAGCLYVPWLKAHFTDKMYTHNISTKTQNAGVEVHIRIIELLRHFNNKYINNLNVIDEGDYWQTSDKKILEEKFNFLGDKIKMLTDFISNGERIDGESLENFIQRIAISIHKL
jgi:hypothetical protein